MLHASEERRWKKCTSNLKASGRRWILQKSRFTGKKWRGYVKAGSV